MSAVPANIESERLEFGSAEHRRLLAQFFLGTHLEYVPEHIEWPALGGEELEPDEAVRRAIELQGFEEHRHARLLMALTSHYRIPVEPPPRYVPRSLESDFLFAGFGECFDSFFAFGLFAIAQQSGLFPPALVQVFEPVLQEEARHILFFVNWVKYRRSQLPWWKRPAFRARCAGIIVKQVAARVNTARALAAKPGGSSENFTLTAHRNLSAPVTLRRLLEACLDENERRLGEYDPRLARPRLVPRIAGMLCRLIPAHI
jgi:hypothetical protein